MFASFGFLAGLGGLACVAALVLFGLRLNKSSGKKAKHASMVVALIAGCAFLATTFGGWLTGWGAWGLFAVAGLIACLGFAAVDWLVDKKPDKVAFWCAVLLPLFLVIGLAQVPTVANMISTGGHQVGTQVSSVTGR